MTLKPVSTSGRSNVTSSVVSTMNLEFNFMCRKKKHSPFHCNTRSTYNDLDVVQEKRVDDNWNVDSNRSLSDSWKGLTKFTLLKEKPSQGINVARSCVARCMDKKLVKLLRIERNKNGRKKSQNSIMLDD